MLRKVIGGIVVVAMTLWTARAALAADASPTTDVATQVRTGLKQLTDSNDRTAASRLILAKLAIEEGDAKAGKDQKASDDAFQAAREVLIDAAKLEPANKEVTDLLQIVNRHVPVPAPAPPATKPANPAPTTKPGDATPQAAVSAKRMVTPAEINRIRQIEWRADENPAPGIRVDPDMRKKFLAANPDILPKDFNALSQDAQARQILDSNKDEFYTGVHIAKDPASIREFKTDAEKIIESSCGNCHNAKKPGRFNIFTEKNDAAVYSNFLILQKYAATVNGAERLMVDRTTPESSLLLQFMIPANITDAPHPPVPGFKAPAATKNDPRYQLALKWLKSSDPLAPHYGIDLSTDEAAPVPVPKK